VVVIVATTNVVASGHTSAVLIPRPDNDHQIEVLQAIWDLFLQSGEFPAFAQLDRRVDQRLDLDALEILKTMPDGLFYGSRWPNDQDKIGVTVAGAAAVAGSAELLGLFVATVRYGADVQRKWIGPPSETTEDAVIKSETLPRFVQIPASGREVLLSCLWELLQTEQWGWRAASGTGASWSFIIDRRVRPYRDVANVQDYLFRRYGPDDQRTSEEPVVDEDPPLTPDERLSIIDRLANRSGPDSQAFFAAHGLGRAYDSVSKGTSKKGHINAALAEAERRHTIDEVYQAARAYLDPIAPPAPTPSGVVWGPAEPMTRTVSGNTSSGGSKMSDLQLFISHAYADRDFAGALKNALLQGGVPTDRIFFSSQRSTGIPAGSDIRQHLRDKLTGSGLVVELLSPKFLERPVCLIEMGAAWALGKSTYPIVVPPLTHTEARAAIGDVLMGQLGSNDEIDDVFAELADRIGDELSIKVRQQNWSEAARGFKVVYEGLRLSGQRPAADA
jgi:hypothetical protein